MDNFNTDTQPPSRDFTRDSVDYWSSIDYQRLRQTKICTTPLDWGTEESTTC